MSRSPFRRLATAGLAVLLIAAGFAAGPAAATDIAQGDPPRFLSVIDDLPLMAGLAEDLDAAMTFDSAAGRIVEARAEGHLQAAAVTAFYRATLPALGWRPVADGQFARGTERLSLEVAPADDGAVAVRFALRPAPR